MSANGSYQSLSVSDTELGTVGLSSFHVSSSSSGSGSSEDRHSYKDKLRSFVFGGIDGLTVSSVFISACIGGSVEERVLTYLGISIMIALALFVGSSEFMSHRAHRDFMSAQYRQHSWDYKHSSKDVQIKGIVDKFVQKGLSMADAEAVVRRVVSSEKFFIRLLVSEDIGIQMPNDSDAVVLLDSICMIFSYAFLGCAPILVYATRVYSGLSHNSLDVAAMSLAAVLLFLLGAAKSIFSHLNPVHAGIEAVAVAAAAAAAANLLGSALARLIVVR